MQQKTAEILDVFSRINAIPRCSGNEAGIAEWLAGWAEENGFKADRDAADNLVIQIPASAGYETAPVIVLQGHMDMVCEKTPDSNHDFSCDPIPLLYKGDWVSADRTSLGADNGIAIAIAMVVAVSPEVAHPPLELLFTVDEETGLNGAKKIQPGFFEGKIFLNIDSEKEGIFTVGCAGGKSIRMRLPLEFRPVQDNQRPVRISISGLCGGHSGIDIHKQRASANVLLARTLYMLHKQLDLRLVDLSGGSVHNAISRDAHAVVAIDGGSHGRLVEMVTAFEQDVRTEYASIETALKINAEPADMDFNRSDASTPETTNAAIRLLMALPHGVAGMSHEMPELVETSGNLATVHTTDNQLNILTSLRSSMDSRLEELSARILSAASLAGASVEIENEYAPWPQNLESPLLERCRSVYHAIFDQTPEIEVIHAGLECAIIGDLFKGMDMISFGPDLENPHSPDERLNIPSIDKIWTFCVALLESYGPE